MLSELVNKITVSPTMRVAAEAKKMKSEGFNIIDLSVGEPDFPTPLNIKEAAKKALDSEMTKYTINAGTVELRKVIAEKFRKDNGLNYNLNEIIVSNGAKQSCFNSIQSVVYKEDEVIIPAPYWVSYPEMVTLAHGKSVIVETSQKNGFKITPAELEKAITSKTRLFILCNPSNPTGSTYTRKELEDIADVCSGKDFFILSDEIYEKLVYDNFRFVSFASLSDEMQRRTIVVNGVSKSYSMTGWRIGYAAGPEEIIKAIDKIQSHSTSHASSISQYATVEALSGPQDEIDFMRNEFQKRRDYFFKELSSIKGITCYKPEGAFFLFPNISAYFGKTTDVLKVTDSFDFAMYLLYDAHVATVPGSSFGAEGYNRFSYAVSLDTLADAADRIKKALSKLK